MPPWPPWRFPGQYLWVALLNPWVASGHDSCIVLDHQPMKGEAMTMECIPLDIMPGTEGVCTTCQNPMHSPADTAKDHGFTMRVPPAGYALVLIPEECPVCRDRLDQHEWFDLDRLGKVVNCDRREHSRWAFE